MTQTVSGRWLVMGDAPGPFVAYWEMGGVNPRGAIFATGCRLLEVDALLSGDTETRRWYVPADSRMVPSCRQTRPRAS